METFCAIQCAAVAAAQLGVASVFAPRYRDARHVKRDWSDQITGLEPTDFVPYGIKFESASWDSVMQQGFSNMREADTHLLENEINPIRNQMIKNLKESQAFKLALELPQP